MQTLLADVERARGAMAEMIAARAENQMTKNTEPKTEPEAEPELELEAEAETRAHETLERVSATCIAELETAVTLLETALMSERADARVSTHSTRDNEHEHGDAHIQAEACGVAARAHARCNAVVRALACASGLWARGQSVARFAAIDILYAAVAQAATVAAVGATAVAPTAYEREYETEDDSEDETGAGAESGADAGSVTQINADHVNLGVVLVCGADADHDDSAALLDSLLDSTVKAIHATASTSACASFTSVLECLLGFELGARAAVRVNAMRQTLLMRACKWGNAEAVRLLLACNAVAKTAPAVDSIGWTALMHASAAPANARKQGRILTVMLGCDEVAATAGARTYEGRTALMIACINDNAVAVEALLRNASVRKTAGEQGHCGETALMLATQFFPRLGVVGFARQRRAPRRQSSCCCSTKRCTIRQARNHAVGVRRS
jgi:hypothetical protein